MSAAVATFGTSFLGAHGPRRGGARRRLAVLLSVLAHFAGVLVLVRLRPPEDEAPPPPVQEPIFLRLAPPPAARPAAAKAPPPPPVRRPPPRPALVQPPPEPLPPVEDPEPVVEESPPEEALEAEAPPLDAPVAVAPNPSAGGRVGGLPGGDGDAVLELRQVARPPVVLEQTKPEYPAEARWRRIEGLVLVRLVIGTDGRVEAGSVRVVRSVAALDDAAVAAMARWRFSPAIGFGGHPVRVAIEVPFQFTLR